MNYCDGEFSAQKLTDNVYLLRHHSSNEGWGGDFDAICTMLIEGETLSVHGLMSLNGSVSKFNKCIRLFAKDVGVKECRWYRFKNGELIKKEIRNEKQDCELGEGKIGYSN